MTRRLIHTIAVGLLAVAAAVLGLWYFVDFDPDALRELAAEFHWLNTWVFAASVAIWLALGNLYLHSQRAWTHAVCFGLLSPAIGCALVAPPWSFVFVFDRPVFSEALGLGTSLAVCGISRLLALPNKPLQPTSGGHASPEGGSMGSAARG